MKNISKIEVLFQLSEHAKDVLTRLSRVKPRNEWISGVIVVMYDDELEEAVAQDHEDIE